MNNWATVARQKLSSLIQDVNFVSISSMSYDYVVIKHERRYARIDKFGRVEWSKSGVFDEH